MAYIREYSVLDPKELRQLEAKRRYKAEYPAWDDSMVLLTRAVAERAPQGADVLDAGCGHGNFVIDELQGRWGRRTGIDVSPEVTSKNVCLDEIVHGRLEQLPFADASFDVVVSLWVLEHLEDPERVFAEISRVLKPGGSFAFVTPNLRSALIRLRRPMPQKLADWINDRFYGRKEDDVFEVQYRANTRADLERISAASGLVPEMLIENPDPSYTSFGPISYRCSALCTRIPGPAFCPHLVGVMRKPS